MTPDLPKLPFIVTDAAGPKVAGGAVKPGDTIHLTEFEARSELLAGVIRSAADPEAVAEVPAVDTATTAETPADDGASGKPARRR
ncbi:hypothetical protein [Azorhizobium doebereinerae]|uniref:hypothetical protein n=1 Tax=Azorhizobium doebereinerae TaxID=281091 RepID=UPI0003FEDF22|nr:hypothetical protein [Azorhizobium doebereinerae]